MRPFRRLALLRPRRKSRRVRCGKSLPPRSLPPSTRLAFRGASVCLASPLNSLGALMSLSDLASLGSFVSGVAVLISLVYLALQVRQAEKNQRAALNQGYVDRTTENLRWLADAPQAALITRVMAGELNFTSEEVFRLSMAFRTSLLSTQDAFLQHRAGLIDEM